MASNTWTRRRVMRGLGSLALTPLLWPAGHALAAQQPAVRIGWTAWADAEIVTKMAALVLSKSGVDVEITLADIPAQYRGLAEGNLDVMLMSWQPKTHAAYLRKYGDQLDDLGVLYSGADLGLAVPDYVDDSIRSIADLASHASDFDARIEGIDPGAGIMKLTHKALDSYGLNNYELRESSGPAMAKRLGEAVAEQRPIVVTAWHPHWMWAQYNLRYLDDPKGIYEGAESVHAVARKGFADDNPQLAGFFKRMHFKDVHELEALMAMAREQRTRPAIRAWLNGHKDRVQSWLTGG